jgi:elongation factor 1-beta
MAERKQKMKECREKIIKGKLNDSQQKPTQQKPTQQKPTQKTLIVLEVKLWNNDIDLEKLWNAIILIEQEGLTWEKFFKFETVYGTIYKLVMSCTIVDSLVLCDDIINKIQGFDDFVQSVDILSMNKI